MMLSVKDSILAYVENSVTKANATTGRIMGKSVFAGMMIGMGAAASSVAAHSVNNVGLARLAASVVFPVGLMMVILLGAELFTGDCLMAMALPEKKITAKDYVRVLTCVYIGNWIGATVLALFIFMSGQLDYSSGLLGAYTIKVALGKTSLSFSKALVSGVCCNILVCAAVMMAGCAKDVAGKLLVSFFVIMLFVTAGFEHCVANMYYITAGLLAKLDPNYVNVAIQQYGLSEAQLAGLNIGSFVVSNLIPVTIGNILGGAALFGLPMYSLNCKTQSETQIKEENSDDKYYSVYATGASR